MPPKSGNLRAKNIGYDDDDLYSDEEVYSEEEAGDGMTDADREQMAIGTAKVKEALGSSYKVTDAQIQDALWNYYYDVGKSVSYLKSTRKACSAVKVLTDFVPDKYAPKPQAPPKAKAVSRFDQAAGAADARTPTITGKHTLICPPESAIRTASGLGPGSEIYGIATHSVTTHGTLSPDYISARTRNFFWDTPWGNIPHKRLSTITMQSTRCKGGLLGGSSKLAALAAKRKQKQQQEEAAAAAKSTGNPDGETADKAVALLDRLNIKDKSSSTTSLRGGDDAPRFRYPRKRSPSPPPTQPEESKEDEPVPEPERLGIQFPNLRAKQPSMFGAILCGSPPDEPERQLVGNVLSSFPLPYANAKEFRDGDLFSKPSPDDLVRQAQARSAGTPKAKAKPNSGDKLAESVEKLVVAETKVKSKNLNVVEEFRKSGMKRVANFVVIGHVDHGKSTLMGRLLYDLKVVDERSVDKLRKEAETMGKSSFALAWVMDQTSEERSRGVTVDIAKEHFETEKTSFTILDAPGHRDFVPNMIAGVSQADFAILVIDAQENSFQSGLKGQTKEHALIVRSMGVQRLIVAVNKMDTVSWSKDRFDKVRQGMTAFFESASFALKNITFVPCAGLTGDNVTKRVDNTQADWYTGPTLIEALDSSEPKQRDVERPLRLTINDIFRGSVQNPLSITGQIEAGSLQVGDTVLALPSKEKATIKGIEINQEPVDWAVAGQIPTLHLVDIDPIHLRLGDVVCDPKESVRLVKSFTCKLLAFEHILPQYVDVFRGRQQAVGLITKLSATLNKTTGEVIKRRPRILKPQDVARVTVELADSKELPLEVGTRIVLRERGKTVAAGLLESYI
ncbi:hypothetical protein N0V90_004559 [Kalmusia sp. IMI 367209]|nr:hypothetical protein N0V90_004559 [Kalmusia sp. IMI 367209]